MKSSFAQSNDQSTSAGSPMVIPKNSWPTIESTRIITPANAYFPPNIATGSSGQSVGIYHSLVSTYILPKSTRVSINKIKTISGLTWDQLAKIFQVSRRSVHFWASGKPLSPFNEELVRRLLETLLLIDRGSADLTRNALLRSHQSSDSAFDLLVAGRFQKVGDLLGAGTAPKKPQVNLAAVDSTAFYHPPAPESLVEALQDSLSPPGKARPAKTMRNHKRDGK
jgi:hypothetical protein